MKLTLDWRYGYPLLLVTVDYFRQMVSQENPTVLLHFNLSSLLIMVVTYLSYRLSALT